MAQPRLKVPVSINIEDGDFSGVSVVMQNNTTGESNSVKGAPKLDLELKINSDYIISFSKPGYITKKMAINTNAPADRAAQGFYPYDFVMNLFPQYEGVNIVIFNQPVGKVFYNRLIDDFDYDTDYTKQIQSALKAADEEVKKKQQEEKTLSLQKKKDLEKQKADSVAQAKADAKAKFESDKKAAEEARLEAQRLDKEKKAQEEQRKLEAKAIQDEEKRKAAIAKIEEEERKKALASEEEESRPKPSQGGGEDKPVAASGSGQGEDRGNSISSGGGSEQPGGKPGTGSGNENPVTHLGKGGGEEEKPSTVKTDPVADAEKQKTDAKETTGFEDRPEATITKKDIVPPQPAEPQYETLPEISVEEISEANRNITRVTVRKGDKETVFSKVIYNWGGIYFFRNTMSISESLYSSSTGQK